MIQSDDPNIKRQLETLNNLQECILLDVVWKNQGTIIELHFNYIWDEHNMIRADLDFEKIIVLRFYAVQTLRVENALNDYMLREPTKLDWGLSEVAKVRLERESKLLTDYEAPVVPLHHIAVLWEGERRIDIVFSGFEVES